MAESDREASDVVVGDSESEVEVEEVEQPPPVVTLLERLRSPTASDLART